MLSQESQSHNCLFPGRRGMVVADVRLSEQDRRHWDTWPLAREGAGGRPE
jgi:hypothetical protein